MCTVARFHFGAQPAHRKVPLVDLGLWISHPRSGIWRGMSQVTVAALYHFTRFKTPEALRAPLLSLAKSHEVRGSLLLAGEGINGTIAGPETGVIAVLAHIRALPGCADFEHKISHADQMPFNRMKVRMKREIVTMGQPDVDPSASVGNYVQAQDWNDLIAQDDVVLIDTRNDYEVEIGTFDGAIDPRTKSFGEFSAWWEDNKDQFAGKKVAMFCTGGIRCEKSTNYLLGQGVEDVFHLKGGILKYLEDVPQEESSWQGECYVFDHRVSVKHGLELGSYDTCFACGRPLTDAAKSLATYEYGVSCPACFDEFSDDRKARFRERQKQVRLAKARGTKHLG
jgi:UPF0176 protein